MEQTAEEIFQGTFTIWAISTSSARFKARLTPEDLNLQESDIDRNVKLGQKNMISDKDRVYLNQATGQVHSFMKLVSRRFFGRGLYAVPEKKILACQEGLKRIREAQAERVEEFLTRYPQEQEKQKAEHPNLVNEEWPTPQEVRDFFSITWKVFQLSAVEAKTTDPDELIQAKAQFQEDLKQGYEDLKNEILGQSYQEILTTIDGISAKLDAGEKITETNFKRPKAVIDQYLSISSIFDLPEITEKVKEIKAIIEGTPAQQIRDRRAVAKFFGEKIKTLSADLETMTGYSKDGRLKRTLDLDDAPEPEPPGYAPAPEPRQTAPIQAALRTGENLSLF